MTITIGFDCRQCGAADNEVEVTIDSASVQGSYSGLPESSYPGEGCEWSIDVDAVCCHACGEVHMADWLYEHLDEAVREQEADRGRYDDL